MSSIEKSAKSGERPIVVLANPIHSEEAVWWQQVVGQNQVRLVVPERKDDLEELARVSRDAIAIVCRRGRIDRRVMENSPRLRLIQKVGWGGNNVDMEAAAALGVRIDVCPSPLRISVAEHTLLLMLALSKQLIPAHRGVERGDNPTGRQPVGTTETVYAYNWLNQTGLQALFRKSLGLVGLGEIGTHVTRRAQGFDMQVRYFDIRRLPEESERNLGIQYATFEELLRGSDYVSLHVPYSQATHHLMGEARFAMMKRSAFLINTCRGSVVDQQALVNALRQGTIAGAGLDVFEEEPLVGEHPFAGMPNVVLTPHISAIREDAAGNILPEIAANIAWAVSQDRQSAPR